MLIYLLLLHHINYCILLFLPFVQLKPIILLRFLDRNEDAALYHVHELLVESFLNNIVVAERLIVLDDFIYRILAVDSVLVVPELTFGLALGYLLGHPLVDGNLNYANFIVVIILHIFVGFHGVHGVSVGFLGVVQLWNLFYLLPRHQAVLVEPSFHRRCHRLNEIILATGRIRRCISISRRHHSHLELHIGATASCECLRGESWTRLLLREFDLHLRCFWLFLICPCRRDLPTVHSGIARRVILHPNEDVLFPP